MDHHRARATARSVRIGQVELRRLMEVELDGGHGRLALDRIDDLHVDLRAVERRLTGRLDVVDAGLVERVAQHRLGLVPHLRGAGVLAGRRRAGTVGSPHRQCRWPREPRGSAPAPPRSPRRRRRARRSCGRHSTTSRAPGRGRRARPSARRDTGRRSPRCGPAGRDRTAAATRRSARDGDTWSAAGRARRRPTSPSAGTCRRRSATSAPSVS